MNFEIKEAKISDVEILEKLGRQTYKDHFSEIWSAQGIENYLESQFKREKLIGDMNDSAVKYFLIYADEIAVGFLKLKLDRNLPNSESEKGVELEKIYFLQEFSGKGLGKKTFEFIVRFAEERGSKIIWLDVLKSNVGAKKFYERNGFRVVSELDFSTDIEKIDFWVMKCGLS